MFTFSALFVLSFLIEYYYNTYKQNFITGSTHDLETMVERFDTNIHESINDFNAVVAFINSLPENVESRDETFLTYFNFLSIVPEHRIISIEYCTMLHDYCIYGTFKG